MVCMFFVFVLPVCFEDEIEEEEKASDCAKMREMENRDGVCFISSVGRHTISHTLIFPLSERAE